MKTFGVRRAILIGGLGVVWLGAVALVTKAQMDRERVAGPEGSAVPTWPRESFLAKPSTLPVLILPVHPRCPCSKATLEELGILHSGNPGRLRTFVLFVRPEGCSDDWVKGANWDLAATIPGAIPIIDPEGREGRRFGACTSGHGLLYAPGGALVFSGGITRGRGLTGSNEGLESIQAYVRGSRVRAPKTSVFGCALQSPDAGR